MYYKHHYNTICPKCSNYPLLSLNKDKPNMILIDCKNCGYLQCCQLNKYFNQIRRNAGKFQDEKQCITHQQIYNNYCKTCKIHICDQCKVHKSHELIAVDEVLPSNFIEKAINNGYQHINKYCDNIKNLKIEKYLKKINLLELSFQSFQKKSNDIFFLFCLIVYNYEQNSNNYYLKSNLMNIKELNLYKFNNDDHLQNLINYFRNYTLLKDYSFVDIKNVKVIHSIHEHSKSVTSLIRLSDGRLASSSADKTIKIYNTSNNYNCDITIQTGHIKGITWICQLNNGKLISCSFKSLKIWSITKTSYQCEHTIENAHDDFIMAVVEITDNKFASCSRDKTITIWSKTPPYTVITKLEGHKASVVSIIQIEDKLISGAWDDMLCIWNSSTYKFEEKIMNVICCWSHSLLELDKNKILVGGMKAIKIVNIEEYIIEQNIQNNELDNIWSLMKLRNGNILCGNDKGVLFCIDLTTFSIVYKKKGHDKTISSLIKFEENNFITSSEDATIKVWIY